MEYDVRLVYADEKKLAHASGGSQTTYLRARVRLVVKYVVEFDHRTKSVCVSACMRPFTGSWHMHFHVGLYTVLFLSLAHIYRIPADSLICGRSSFCAP
jgi:hypothetical protein